MFYNKFVQNIHYPLLILSHFLLLIFICHFYFLFIPFWHQQIRTFDSNNYHIPFHITSTYRIYTEQSPSVIYKYIYENVFTLAVCILYFSFHVLCKYLLFFFRINNKKNLVRTLTRLNFEEEFIWELTKYSRNWIWNTVSMMISYHIYNSLRICILTYVHIYILSVC